MQRACFNCRKRKQGCDEERPCRRCLEKGIECLEVETKRKRGRAKQDPSLAGKSTLTALIRSHLLTEDDPNSLSSEEEFEGAGNSSDSELGDELASGEEGSQCKDDDDCSSADEEDIAMEDDASDSDESDEESAVQQQFIPESRIVANDELLRGHRLYILATLLPFFNSSTQNVTEEDLHAIFDDFTEEVVDDDSDLGDSDLAWDLELTDEGPKVEQPPPRYRQRVSNGRWNTFVHLIKCDDDNLKYQLLHVKEIWLEVIRALRILDWNKVQR